MLHSPFVWALQACPSLDSHLRKNWKPYLQAWESEPSLVSSSSLAGPVHRGLCYSPSFQIQMVTGSYFLLFFNMYLLFNILINEGCQNLIY